MYSLFVMGPLVRHIQPTPEISDLSAKPEAGFTLRRVWVRVPMYRL